MALTVVPVLENLVLSRSGSSKVRSPCISLGFCNDPLVRSFPVSLNTTSDVHALRCDLMLRCTVLRVHMNGAAGLPATAALPVILPGSLVAWALRILEAEL